jgi:hypothetical protein
VGFRVRNPGVADTVNRTVGDFIEAAVENADGRDAPHDDP